MLLVYSTLRVWFLQRKSSKTFSVFTKCFSPSNSDRWRFEERVLWYEPAFKHVKFKVNYLGACPLDEQRFCPRKLWKRRRFACFWFDCRFLCMCGTLIGKKKLTLKAQVLGQSCLFKLCDTFKALKTCLFALWKLQGFHQRVSLIRRMDSLLEQLQL